MNIVNSKQEIVEKVIISPIGFPTRLKVLEKTGFDLVESFEEDGRESKYFQKCL